MKSLIKGVLIVFILGYCSLVYAAEYGVGDNKGILYSGYQCSRVEYAIDKLASGDTLWVSPGEYALKGFPEKDNITISGTDPNNRPILTVEDPKAVVVGKGSTIKNIISKQY